MRRPKERPRSPSARVRRPGDGVIDPQRHRVDEHEGDARAPAARAIGEIGLDYHYNFAPPDVQQQVFRAQVSLAYNLDLPVVIHTREADDDTVRILREEGAGRLR